jgi:uncharacterized membrane protein YebE (DUF533 family)
MQFNPIEEKGHVKGDSKQYKSSSRGGWLNILKGLLTIASLAAIGFLSFDLLSNKDMEGAPPVVNSSDYVLPSQTESIKQTQDVVGDTIVHAVIHSNEVKEID